LWGGHHPRNFYQMGERTRENVQHGHDGPKALPEPAGVGTPKLPQEEEETDEGGNSEQDHVGGGGTPLAKKQTERTTMGGGGTERNTYTTLGDTFPGKWVKVQTRGIDWGGESY